jgi:hypothetical protein
MNKLILIIAPLVGVNIWHAVLLLGYSGNNRPDTLSEHACRSRRWLFWHKTVHVLVASMLICFAIVNLWVNDQYLISAVLIVGSTLDIIEALTLKKGDPTHPIVWNTHQVTAWLMAFCYLTYGFLIAREAGFGPYVYHGVWVTFGLNLYVASKFKFRKFWISQYGYFFMLSVVIVLANLQLN